MASISTKDVARAKAELAGMKSSLLGWLKYRATNDAILAGTGTTRKPMAYAQTVIGNRRDMGAEQKLATQLHVLLSEVAPGLTLPDPDVSSNPNAAVQLAAIAIKGGQPSGPAAVAGLQPWVLPVVVASALLIGVTTAIQSAADVAKDKERIACIEAGACTDYGFWLKAASVAGIAWLVWKEFGVGAVVKSHIAKGGRS